MVAGRATFEPADGLGGDHHDGVHIGVAQRDLERIRVLEGEDGVTHLRYRVRR